MQGPGPSQIPVISGTAVGLLDSQQATRLLSAPGSKLSFATFHPRTASAGARKLSTQDELCSQKRVVIETLISGESFWRWVPRAKGVDTAGGEGSWPRVINICGQFVECSQDQWDIYKLDPEYECVVRPQPELTTITRREAKETLQAADPVSPYGSPRKRRVEDVYETSLPQMKRKRQVLVETENEDDSDSDEEAVEGMIVDDAMPGAWRDRRRAFAEGVQRNRKARREKTAARTSKVSQPKDLQDASDLSMIDLTIDETPTSTQPQNGSDNPFNSQSPTVFSSTNTVFTQPPATSSIIFGSTHADSNSAPFFFKRSAEPAEGNSPTKRTRTRSPSPTFAKKFDPERKEMYRRKLQEFQKVRMRRTVERSAKRKEAQQRALEEDIRAAAQATLTPPSTQSNEYSPSDRGTSTQPSTQPSPDIEDPISLEEKIRRIAEINAYEEARVAKELERQRAEQAAEEKRRRQEEQRAREKVRAEREARQREAELKKQRELQREEAERRKREQEREEMRRKTQQQQDRWAYGPWTTQRALERYKMLSEVFDTAQFTPENPIAFLTVPWPVLHKPTELTVEDVDWGAVEAFFRAIRPHMRTQDYKTLIEKSHRRFHPDRWRARRVLQSVQDDELKACLEVAANTVAQALTPLWRELKST